MLDDYINVQPIAYQILYNGVKNDRCTHAYLLEARGYSKVKDFAIAYAKYLLCPFHNSNLSNCNGCNQCQVIDDDNFTEIKIIEPDGQWIKKEQLDELQKEFSTKAVTGNKKVYIIVGADRLNSASANSILKFLEEPEENIYAILIADNVYQLLDTIVSRCQVITLNKNQKGQHTELEAQYRMLMLLAEELFHSEDKINDYFNDKTHLDDVEAIVHFVEFFEQRGKDTLLYTTKLWHNFFSNREEIGQALDIVLFYYKDVLNLLCGRSIHLFEFYRDRMEKLLSCNDFQSLSHKITCILNAKEKLLFNMNTNLLIDQLILEMGVYVCD